MSAGIFIEKFMPRSVRSVKVLILALSLCMAGAAYFFASLPSAALSPWKSAGSLSALSLDAAAYAKLKVDRSPASLTPQDVTFNDYSLFYDQPAGVYFYSAVGKGNAAFDPWVAVHGGYGVAFAASPISETSIAQNSKHRFMIYTDRHYAEYAFVVTTLPLIAVETPHPEILSDTSFSRNKFSAHMTLFDNNAAASSHRVIESELSIHTRGASSRHYPQKSYRLSLKYLSLGRHKRISPTSLLGMRKDEDWILYAPYNDPEKIRNVLSNNLWWDMGAAGNTLGAMNGTQAKFVELFINRRYQGIYALMPPVDAKQLRLETTGDPAKTDYLYRKDRSTPAVSAVFKNRIHRDEVNGFSILYPKHTRATYAKWAPLETYLGVLGAPDDVYAKRFAALADMDNAINVWLFVNLTLGYDNILKGMSYIAKWTGSRYVMAFSPWDMDQTWGLLWKEDSPYLTELSEPPTQPLRFDAEMPAGRAVERDFFNARARALERYVALRNGTLSDESFARRIAAYDAEIFGSGAMLRNRERWPTARYAENMDAFSKFVKQRLAFMDEAVAALRGQAAAKDGR